MTHCQNCDAPIRSGDSTWLCALCLDEQRAEWAATEALSEELRDATQLTLRQAQETHT